MIDQSLISSFITVAIFIIAMVAFLIIFKKLINKKSVKGLQTSLNIISKLPLTSKAMLCTVKVNNKILLLGVTEQNIRLLADLTSHSKEEIQKALEREKKNLPQPSITSNITPKEQTNPTSFSAFLKQAFKRSIN